MKRQIRSLVGARPYSDIAADPLASAEEIKTLFAEDQVKHPNCPPDLWWDAAKSIPLNAMESPLFPLLTLEEPGRWEEMEQTNSAMWVSTFNEILPPPARRLLAADYAERVLHFVIPARYEDARLAIAATRDFAQHKITEENLKAAFAVINHDLGGVGRAWNRAATAAAYAAMPPNYKGGLDAWNAADNAYYAVLSANKGKRNCGSLLFAERVWQWRRLLHYLHGEAEQTGNSSVVGARTPPEVKADPQATATEIEDLAIHGDSLDALRHPNCPQELWWNLAATYPIEAMESPLYALLTLEDPERWAQMESLFILRWLESTLNRLPFSSQQMFAAECLDRVLPLFERIRPKDQRPRKAIEVRRRWAEGKATIDEWSVATSASYEASRTNKRQADYEVARGAYLENAYSAISAVARAAGHANTGQLVRRHLGEPFDGVAWRAELQWQWRRLQTFVKSQEKEREPVGAKSPYRHIRRNPTATEAELDLLEAMAPKEALAHPNCHVERWWGLAQSYPVEAHKSVLFGIFTLEDPERWLDLVQIMSETWISLNINKLTAKKQRLFAADCAERVLPIIAAEYPADDRARDAITVARSFARGKGSVKGTREAYQVANQAARDMAVKADNDDCLYASWAGLAAASAVDPASAERGANHAVEYAALARGHANAKERAAREAEHVWQWQRFMQYVRGEFDE